MQFFLTFLEGFISFVSPCMLPMLPIYVSYFSGGADKKKNVFARALAFVVGFTAVFCLLGLFTATLGRFVNRYQTAVNILCGLIVIFFGLSYLDVIRIPIFKGVQRGQKVTGVLSAFLFGMIYSVNLTPCVGAFLSSALAMATASGKASMGVLLLLAYSLGLGIPFLLSAMLIDRLSGAFTWIKKHYRVINIISGCFLILTGIVIASGALVPFLNLFS